MSHRCSLNYWTFTKFKFKCTSCDCQFFLLNWQTCQHPDASGHPGGHLNIWLHPLAHNTDQVPTFLAGQLAGHVVAVTGDLTGDYGVGCSTFPMLDNLENKVSIKKRTIYGSQSTIQCIKKSVCSKSPWSLRTHSTRYENDNTNKYTTIGT